MNATLTREQNDVVSQFMQKWKHELNLTRRVINQAIWILSMELVEGQPISDEARRSALRDLLVVASTPSGASVTSEAEAIAAESADDASARKMRDLLQRASASPRL